MAKRADIWALVPLKPVSLAKQRLASVLSPEQRPLLILAMLRDVLQALCVTLDPQQVSVLSDDPIAAQLAAECGARFLPETPSSGGPGLNGAVTGAVRGMVQAGRRAVMIVHADLPLLSATDIEMLIAAWSALPGARRVAIARSGDGGSNLVLASPPDVIPFRYGRNSHARHLAECRRHACAATSLDLAGGAIDVDRPEDLDSVVRAAHAGSCGSRTAQALSQLGLLSPTCSLQGTD